MGHGFQISQTRLKPELIQGDPLTVQNPSWRLLEHPRASPKIPELNGYKWRFVAGKINDQGGIFQQAVLDYQKLCDTIFKADNLRNPKFLRKWFFWSHEGFLVSKHGFPQRATLHDWPCHSSDNLQDLSGASFCRRWGWLEPKHEVKENRWRVTWQKMGTWPTNVDHTYIYI